MFAVLRVLPDDNSLSARIKFKLRPPQPLLERINVMSAAPFYYLEIHERQCGRNFEQVSKILGRCAHNLIVCGEYHLPDNPNIKRFYPSKLPRVLLLNTALDLTKRLSASSDRLSLSLIDYKGNWCDYAYEFVKYAKTVRVITNACEKYTQAAENIFDEYGASLIINDNISSVSGCDIVVSPDNNKERFYNTCVLRCYPDGRQDLLKGKGYCLPKEYLAIMPAGIDEFLFACALYELCGVKKLGELKYDCFENMNFNNA